MRDAPRRYRFGELLLDVGACELRRRDAVIAVQPKVLDALAYLIERRERVVPKGELLAALWPKHISEAVLPTCIAAVRRALGDDGDAQRFVKTVHGRGYQFIAEVEPLAPSAPPVAPVIATPGETPFVGREALCATLENSLDRALGGHGQAAILCGEAGIGKSRTAMWLCDRARARGAVALWASCHETEGAPSFWPWVQIARQALRGRAADALRERLGAWGNDLAFLAPELGRMLSIDAQPITRSPEQARFRLLDGASRFLGAAASARGFLMVIDAAQWADAASIALLRYVAEQLDDQRWMLLVTARPTAVDHPLTPALAALVRLSHAQRHDLAGLSEDEVERLLAAGLAGRAAAGVELARDVHRLTGGNPLFVAELARAIAGGERIDGGAIQPGAARAAVVGRLTGVSSTCRRMIDAVAVLDTAPLALLERVSGLAREDLMAASDEAANARLLEAADGALRFRHDLVRAVVYGELAPSERTRLHLAAAEALEQALEAEPEKLRGPHLAPLAEHFLRAGTAPAKAFRHSVGAADHALSVLAYEDAERLYRRALSLESEHDAALRAAVRLRLGEALSLAGRRELARQVFTEVAELGHASGRAELIARAALGTAGRYERPLLPDEPLRHLLVRAREALGAKGDARLCALVTARLACLPPNVDSVAGRQELTAEALALATQSGDPEALAVALAARDLALFGPDHLEERARLADQLEALAEKSGDVEYAVRAQLCRFGVHVASGDASAARQQVHALGELAELLRRPVDRWLAGWLRASVAVTDGRWDEAEQLLATTLASAERMGDPSAPLVCTGQSLILYGLRGRYEEVERGLEAFVDFAGWSARVRSGVRALASSELERFDQARALLAGATRLRELPRDEHWYLVCCTFALAAANVGDRERAGELYALLEPHADRLAYHDMLRIHIGSVSFYLGALATTLGRHDAAERHLAHALASHEHNGAAPMQMVTRLEWARLQRARGDAAGAREHALACVEAARALGSSHYVARAAKLLRG